MDRDTIATRSHDTDDLMSRGMAVGRGDRPAAA